MPTIDEVHFALVSDNDDPDKRGRLKLLSQSMVGASIELPEWVEPEAPLFMSGEGGGSLWIPIVGSTVEVIASVHDTGMDEMKGERFLQNPSMRWRHAAPTRDAPQPLPEELKANYPNCRGFVTPAGHKVIMDDTDSMYIEGKDGGKIELKADGSIVMSSPTLLGPGATELMVLGNLFMTLYNAHIHPTGVGPSGPPAAAMTTAHLSQEGNKVK